MKNLLDIFTTLVSTVFLLSWMIVNTASAHSITLSVNDAKLTIDDFGRISSFIIEGQENMNEAYWYTSVRKTGSGNPYTAPLRVDASNYTVIEHVTAVGTDGWSLKVERNTAPSDIQFEYTGSLSNGIVGDGTASFAANAFWRNVNYLTTGKTDCDCYLFIDTDLFGTPNNDIATLTENNGVLTASFVDQVEGYVFGVSVDNAVEWEIDNNLALQSKLDNATSNIGLAGVTSPYGPDNIAVAFKAVTDPPGSPGNPSGGLDADGCGCDININPVPLPATVWLFGSGLIGLMSFQRGSFRIA